MGMVIVAIPTDATMITADVTTNNVTSTKHGFAPKSGADDTKFLNGSATPAYAAVKDSDLANTDVTTNDASTSKHGFLKKLDNDTTPFLDGQGTWAVPPYPAGQEVKVAVTTSSTNDVTTSASYVDTTLSVTLAGLTAAKTYNLVAQTGAIQTYNRAANLTMQLLIDGTQENEVAPETGQIYRQISLAGMKAGVTGSTSYIAKVQIKSSSAGQQVDINVNTWLMSITLTAIEA